MSPRTIYGIGRNYAAHVREMKSEVLGKPLVFLKPASSWIQTGQNIELPRGIGRVDYETELVVRISKPGRRISKSLAWEYVDAVAVGIDVTARDLQNQAKEIGYPWALCKGLSTIAPVGNFVKLEELGERPWTFELQKNGEVVQRGNSKDMLIPIDGLISYLSDQFSLEQGDWIFTGSPEGVGPLHASDRLHARAGKSELTVGVIEI